MTNTAILAGKPEDHTVEELILFVAAGLTRAKDALRPDPSSRYYDAALPVRHSEALGNLSYGIEYFWHAVAAIREDGKEFTNWQLDEPFGMMARAMQSLRHDDSECNMWAQLEPLGRAHKILNRLNRQWGYPEITNEMIARVGFGVGGGR